MCGILTAVATGSPFSAEIIPFATSTETPICASTVDAPKCGVKITFGKFLSGEFSASGSEV